MQSITPTPEEVGFRSLRVKTTARPEALELTANRFERGRLPRKSYVSPWSVLRLKDSMITKQPAEATEATVDDVRRELETYLRTG